MTANRLIQKVSYDGEQVKIAYTITRDGGADPDELTLTCGDIPRPELLAALEALRPFVGPILDVTDTAWGEAIEIRGVLFGWKHGTMAARLNCVRLCENGKKFCFLTPSLASETEENEDGAPGDGAALGDDLVAALEAVVIEACRYADGERTQGCLPLSDGNNAAAGANPEGQGSLPDGSAGTGDAGATE